jgi:hypothetical protein
MAVMTAKKFEELQKQTNDRLQQFLKKPLSTTGLGLPQEDPRARLDELRTNLASATRDRDESVRLANDRIDRLKRAIATIEATLASTAPTTEEDTG